MTKPLAEIHLPKVNNLISQLAVKLQQYLAAKQLENPLYIGIHTGGAWVAERLHQEMHSSQPLGSLDISFYRDDFSTQGLNPRVKPSNLPFATQDQNLVLIDDVIMSGRTIRAAMNEIFDYGRPASITLVTLVNLTGRHLPIQPDISALELDLPPQQRLKLSGPKPLELNLVTQPQLATNIIGSNITSGDSL